MNSPSSSSSSQAILNPLIHRYGLKRQIKPVPLYSTEHESLLIKWAVDQVQLPPMRQFLACVLAEPEARQVLIQQSSQGSKTNRLNVQSLQNVAAKILSRCPFYGYERDIITLLQGVQHLLKSCLMGGVPLKAPPRPSVGFTFKDRRAESARGGAHENE